MLPWRLTLMTLRWIPSRRILWKWWRLLASVPQPELSHQSNMCKDHHWEKEVFFLELPTYTDGAAQSGKTPYDGEWTNVNFHCDGSFHIVSSSLFTTFSLQQPKVKESYCTIVSKATPLHVFVKGGSSNIISPRHHFKLVPQVDIVANIDRLGWLLGWILELPEINGEN